MSESSQHLWTGPTNDFDRWILRDDFWTTYHATDHLCRVAITQGAPMDVAHCCLHFIHCMHCGEFACDHVGTKCVFSPTEFGHNHVIERTMSWLSNPLFLFLLGQAHAKRPKG